MTYPSDYKSGQVLTAAALNASFDGKTENTNAAISGGYVEGLDHVYVVGTDDSVSPITGALIVTGGVGIGLRLNVGGKLTAAAGAAVQAATVSTDPATGALTVVGGVGIGGSVNVGGGLLAVGNLTGAMIISRDITNAVDPVTGALTTAGGAGIAKDLHVGGAVAVGGGLSVQGNAVVAGSVTAGSVVIAPGGGITFGDGSTQIGAPIPEAPSDGKKYGRGDKLWKLLTDIPEAPLDAHKYGRDNAAWVVLTDIPEAPADGKLYSRKNATWVNSGTTNVNGEITLVDGAAANEVLPAWAPISFDTVTGTAFNKNNATTLSMQGDGPTTIQIAVDMNQAQGGSVVFGYTLGSGAAVPIELGRIKLDSAAKVRVKAQYNILLKTNDLLHLWISSDVAYAGLAWSAGVINAFLNQTVGIPEAPIDQNQYTRKGGGWVQVSASGMWRSDVPPVDVERYPQWYNTNTSTLYVWYDDGDSAQWVICVPVPGTDEMTGAIWGQITGDILAQEDLIDYIAAQSGPGGGIPEAPEDGTLYGRQDAAWVAVPAGGGAVTYPLLAPNGTKAAPSFSWASAPDTGWYKSNANEAAYSFAGKEILTISSGGGDYTELIIGPENVGSSVLTLFDQNRNNGMGNSLGIAVGQNGVISFNSYSPTFTDYSMSFSAPAFTFNGIVNVHSTLNVNGANIIQDIGGLTTNALTINKPTTAGESSILFGNKGTAGGAIGRWLCASNSGDLVYQNLNDADGSFMNQPLVLQRSNGNAWIGGNSASNVQIPQVLSRGGASLEVDIHPAAGYNIPGPGWPDTAGGLIAVRGNTSASYGAAAVSIYTGSGSTGVAIAGGQSAWGALSDDRLKTLDTDVIDGLAAVLAIRPIRFKYLTDAPDFPMRIGLSAQSVQTHIPEAISEVPLIEGPDKTLSSELYLSLRYTEVIPHLVAAIKEMSGQLTTSQTKVATLEHKLQAINDALDSL
jgi:hypothetical protein